MSILQGCDFTDDAVVRLLNYGQTNIISRAAKLVPPVVLDSSLEGWLDLYTQYFVNNFYRAARDVLHRRTALETDATAEEEVASKCGVMERGIVTWGAQTRLARELLRRNKEGEQEKIHEKLAEISERSTLMNLVVRAETQYVTDRHVKNVAIRAGRRDFKERGQDLPSPHSYLKRVQRCEIHRYMQERIVEARTGDIHMDADMGMVHVILTDFMTVPITDNYVFTRKAESQQQQEQNHWQRQQQQQQQGKNQATKPLGGYAKFIRTCTS